ncbi:hypothetical protein SAE02_67050 [Skermanella aerolata]|uniref:Myeloperoxidase n=1 Tax=Skermanella aerolata TaxID=393310 RepID=A0A512E1E7_9PROT|nr:heme peroxidase family protein [Skermanella aerolata]KJB91427.1 heme peroxidase [Skermanella aerolata KACC 11604]GEO42557.1 hypothetical protein SAE02_67050 [Skermanella aerolata]
MLLDFSHGGHAIPEKAAPAGTDPAGKTLLKTVSQPETGEDFDTDAMTRFRFLSEDDRPGDKLVPGTKTVQALDALGEAMVDQDDKGNPDSTIPPIYTYWSQFIDHELTARTDRTTEVSDITLNSDSLKPAPRTMVEDSLFNRRTPAIELDCIYGDRPPRKLTDHNRKQVDTNLRLASKLRDGARMRIGTAVVVSGPDGLPVGALPGRGDDLHRDLPRIGAMLDLGVVSPGDFPPELAASPTFRHRAFIGDPRNDENLAVAQFHTALLRFHNAVVDWLMFKDPRRERRSTDELFSDARRIVTWTHQYLVVHDFLKRLAMPEVVDDVLGSGAKLYRRRLRSAGAPFFGMAEPYMPVEFSVACYRFGHSMIRDSYDYNRNFGRKPDDTAGFLIPKASLNQFFQFTGKSAAPMDPAGKVPGPEHLPHNWIIEWDHFDGTAFKPETADTPARVARRIDTHIAPSLATLANEGSLGTNSAPSEDMKRISALLKHLARRNLRRGYQLSLPTGQALARIAEVPALTRDELAKGNTKAMNDAMDMGGFFDRTPLWFYILKEAEVKTGGERLGELGSRIVANTIIGVLLTDHTSYLTRDPSWDPSKIVPGAGGPLTLPGGGTIATIGDLLQFAGVK